MKLIDCLPTDWTEGTFVGRLQTEAGPTPIGLRNGRVLDLSAATPTISELFNRWQGELPQGTELAPLHDLPLSPAYEDRPAALASPRLLAPLDLQCVKACGVTFAVSAVERVIEERARGDYKQAQAIRDELGARIGTDIRSVRPGSETAMRLKDALVAQGLWSQYLEVAIGPDAEVFTKCPTLAAVGWGDWIGVRKESQWNNPEPEILLVCDSQGRALGAALGNDVNLRDIEGRSALLLGKAKDNNASCAVGPFIRMFDATFTIDDVRAAVVELTVEGEDGYKLTGSSSMAQISRDPLNLVEQTTNQHHYPDGFALFLGTMFAPTEDRDVPGRGFTHKLLDTVQVSSPKLGILDNKLTTSDQAPPWSYGLGQLMANLAKRGLLQGPVP